jgi:hypothetical protein
VSLPQIAERLRELSGIHAIPELSELADKMRRKPPVRRAPPASTPMTPELAAEIRVFAERHPQATFTRIGRTFNVNIGRVSEVLNEAR